MGKSWRGDRRPGMKMEGRIRLRDSWKVICMWAGEMGRRGGKKFGERGSVIACARIGGGRGGDGAILKKYLAGSMAVMGEEVVKEVAELARSCEKFFGRPQDIEWAMEGGKVYLLQSRAITTIAKKEDATGAYQLWDNSNIAESY